MQKNLLFINKSENESSRFKTANLPVINTLRYLLRTYLKKRILQGKSKTMQEEMLRIW